MHLTVHGRSESTDKMTAYLASAFETLDAGEIAHALGVAARAVGMSHVANEAGCAREQLYRSLSRNGNPTLKTVLAILGALTASEASARKMSSGNSSVAKLGYSKDRRASRPGS